MVPVLHLVGVPSTTLQKDKPILHHTLGDGRFVVLIKRVLYVWINWSFFPRYDAYTIASKQFTVMQTALYDNKEAAKLIDQTLVECITKARVHDCLHPSLTNTWSSRGVLYI